MNVTEMTEDELFDEIRELFNLGRNEKPYDRERLRELSKEMSARGKIKR